MNAKLKNLRILYKIIFFTLMIIFFISLKLLSSLKVLICTVAKQENKYIKEFISHYQKLNFKKIIIYDNNDINGENFESILKNEINNNFIKIINYRGFKNPQIKALNDCYERMKYNFNWISFFDVDEFLYIRNYTNINNFLSLPIFQKCQSILINWKYFGDNDQLYYQPKPLNKRFNKPLNFTENKMLIKDKYFFSAAKSIVRGGLNIIWGLLPHFLNNTINCRPDGSILNNYFSPYQHQIAYLKHYITKSTEEFIERLKRGDVLLEVNRKYIFNRINNYYFLFNRKTKKKEDLLKKYINNKFHF